jgi:hypothetical protein
MLVVALGLGALIWSCESEQTGYEVAVPLLGPTEFDETSCEGSGDICSTDDDCFDEDGFNVGPCTKTMEELAAITVPVSLSPSNPSYTLGSVDTAGWTNLFLGQQFADGEVPEQLRIVMTMDNFSLQGGPVTIGVRIFSRVGLIVGRNADYQPVTPSSCTFTLADGATGQDYADGINTCLSDWISENGSPVEFDMEVTSSEGAAAKSGFGLKQEGEYMVDGRWDMTSDNQCDWDGTDDVLEAVREGEGFFARLACQDLTLEGSGQTDQSIGIVGGAAVWDRCGNFSLAILAPTGLPGGPTIYTVHENAVEGDVPVLFLPPGVSFAESLLGAATGKCLSDNKPKFPEGRGWAGWIHCGPTPPPPRTGYIEVSAKGFCEVVQDGAGATGGSGQ